MSFENINGTLGVLENYQGKLFLGKVVQNNDPEKLDRVKASVNGLWSTDEALMPWCGPIKFSPMGQGEGYGVFGVPPIGADVVVALLDGNPHHPVFMSIQTTAGTGGPGSWGFTDPAGNKLTVNADGTKYETACGASIFIDKDCKATMTFPGGLEINADTVINGDVETNGNHKISGDLDVGGSLKTGGSAAIGGSVNATGNVTGAGKSLATHWHAVLSKDFGVTSPPL